MDTKNCVCSDDERCMMGQCKGCPGQNGLVDFLNQFKMWWIDRCWGSDIHSGWIRTGHNWSPSQNPRKISSKTWVLKCSNWPAIHVYIYMLHSQMPKWVYEKTQNFHDTNGRNHSSGRLCQKLLLRSSGWNPNWFNVAYQRQRITPFSTGTYMCY